MEEVRLVIFESCIVESGGRSRRRKREGCSSNARVSVIGSVSHSPGNKGVLILEVVVT